MAKMRAVTFTGSTLSWKGSQIDPKRALKTGSKNAEMMCRGGLFLVCCYSLL